MDFSSRLAGKTVLVTAAAAGMGRASAIRMAREGARVIATDINRSGLEELSSQSGIDTAVLDVTDRAAIEQLLASIDSVDVLFNCAGSVATDTVLECQSDAWTRAWTVNVTSCYLTIQACLPKMLTSGAGSIINMASVVSSIKGAPNRFSYGTTKAAIIGLTKSVAIDFVARGIRCNAICPGTVDTPSLQQRLHDTGDYAKARQAFEARQPMQRLGTADEVASLVAYLASDESSFITGQAYAVDGGWSI